MPAFGLVTSNMIETGIFWGFFHAKFHIDGHIMSPMQDKKLHINQIVHFFGCTTSFVWPGGVMVRALACESRGYEFNSHVTVK